MRLNKDIQKLADERARKEGYFCASYYGRDGEKYIFLPMYADSQERCEGLFVYIVVNDMKARIHRGLNYTELSGIKHRDLYRGRAIYREFERKYDHDDFANDEEREYISEIVQNQRSGYDIPVPKNTLYDYLEIADRFGMKLILEVEEWSKERHDGWVYYLVLKEFEITNMNEVINIDEKNYGDYRNLNIVAFSFAFGGAMGSPGEIIVITKDAKIYSMNYCFGDMTIEMCYQVCPPLRDCSFGPIDVEKAPEGWEGVSLGFGNFLVLSEPLYTHIKAEMLHMRPSFRYRSWKAIVLDYLKRGIV